MANILIYTDWRCESSTAIIRAILEKLACQKKEQHIDLVTPGDPAAEWIETFSKTSVDHIEILTEEDSSGYSPDACLHALYAFIKTRDYEIVFAPATSRGRDVLPGLSVLFGTGLASELVDFSLNEEGFFGSKLLFGGKCLADVELMGPKPWFATVHSSVGADEETGEQQEAEVRYYDTPPYELRLKVERLIHSESDRPALASADIIVAGGRGLRDSENMALLEELADTLDAGIGASMGAVESDYASRDILIGQSGTQIESSLYIACGISGAMQHLAGIRNAKKILAVNTDPNAPIMRMADYAIIGDLKKVLPEMITCLKRNRQN